MIQASLRDAVPIGVTLPGVGNAGLFSEVPPGPMRPRREPAAGPGGTADNSPPVPLAGMRDPRSNRVPLGKPERAKLEILPGSDAQLPT